MNNHHLREPKYMIDSQDIIQIRLNMPTDIAYHDGFYTPHPIHQLYSHPIIMYTRFSIEGRYLVVADPKISRVRSGGPCMSLFSHCH